MDKDAFGAREGNLDRPLCENSEHGGVVLDAHILLAAETAADHLGDDAHLFRRQARRLGAFALCLIDPLVGAVDHDAVALGHGDRRLRLQKRVLGRRRAVAACDDVFGAADFFLRVAAHKMLMREQIAAFMHLRRAVRHRLGGRKDGRQLLVFDRDELFCLLKRLFSLSRDERHSVSEEMRDPAYRDQHIVILFQMANLLLAGQAGGRDDGCDAGEGARLRHVD